jgi:hypothetical protein
VPQARLIAPGGVPQVRLVGLAEAPQAPLIGPGWSDRSGVSGTAACC